MPSADLLLHLTAVNPGDTITASAVGSTVIDLSAVLNDLGTGAGIKIVAQVGTAFTDAGSDSTVQVTLDHSSDNSSYTSNVQSLGTFPALSAVGAKLEAFLQPGAITKRYLRCNFTVANGNLSTGSVVVFITDAFDHTVAYPVGTPIS